MSTEASVGGIGRRKGRRIVPGAAVTIFLIGICLGIVMGERLFLLRQELATKNERRDGSNLQRNDHLKNNSDGTSSWKARHTASTMDDASAGKISESGLEAILRDVAPTGEVLIAISNFNLVMEGSLMVWLDCVHKAGVNNWLVVAIDENLRNYCKSNEIPHFYRPTVIPKSQKDTGDNHAVSAMKYEIVREFLLLGWNVLLSDVDVVVVQDPFNFLYRDSDVEGMTDGYDGNTAYGSIYTIDDPSMGWSRYAQGFRHMVLNSGLFYVKANQRTILLMERIANVLNKESAWDQTIWNREIFLLSHGNFKSPQVSVRVMEYDLFMNSKVLFKSVRYIPRQEQRLPVMVHMNYHPNKQERMRAAVQYYFEGVDDALDRFPGGSEPGT